MDVARILTLPTEVLAKTDIADYALSALQQSNIKEVVLLGRRGHSQGAFNNPELEELEHLPNVNVEVDFGQPINDSHDLGAGDWLSQRKFATLIRLNNRQPEKVEKRIVFKFLTSPLEIVGDSCVEKIVVGKNRLVDNNGGRLVAQTTGERYSLDSNLILRAIGYRGCAIPGLPFDHMKGIIPNIHGRLVADGITLSGIYVAGWIKRGPRGVIGTNKKCSRDTVSNLLIDYKAGLLTSAKLDYEEILKKLKNRQPNLVDRERWLSIDQVEIAAGRSQQRPRTKLTSKEDLLRAAIVSKHSTST